MFWTGKKKLPLRRMLIVFSTLVSAGCGDDTPTETAATAVAGGWSGSIEDDLAGNGTISLTLSQAGASVSGTWSMDFPEAPSRNLAGSVSGILSGSTVTSTLSTAAATDCTLALTGVVAGSAQTTMAGGYTSNDCIPERTGSFTATRQ